MAQELSEAPAQCVVYESSGPLRYGHDPKHGYKLIVEVDPDIANLARWLCPVKLATPRYAPHISVVRHEPPQYLRHWGKYEGRVVPFLYETWARNDERYYWVRAFSDDLAEIRVELGLPGYGRINMDPSLPRCYHITIGNTK